MPLTKSARKTKRLTIFLGSVVGKLMADLGIDPYSRNVVFSRLKTEGPAFLTKTLPKFSGFLLRAIEEGKLPKARFSELSHFEWKGGSPRFLRGLLMDAMSGSANAVYKIRQLCDYFYKTAFSFTEEALADAEAKYVSIENELTRQTVDYAWIESLRKTFETLLPKCTGSHVHHVLREYRPRNGPGYFARSSRFRKAFGLSPEAIKRLRGRITGTHPRSMEAASGYFKPYPSAPEATRGVSEDRSCEVIFVPKDSRGPRVISKEPYFHLKAQMAYGDWLSRTLEEETRFRINFRSQRINQELSREGSVSGNWATLDLKEASDRVLLYYWRAMTRNSPAISWFNKHARSTHATLPSGKRLKLKKLANMGSGMCFASLACFTWISAVTGISRRHRVPRNVAGRSVYVYGDDIIVPKEWLEAAVSGLERSGLQINREKSFSKGPFRESCGADYMNGTSVTPVRLRLAGAELEVLPQYRDGKVSIETDAGVLQLERHCRELIDSGLDSLANHYYGLLERFLGTLPIIHRDSPVLGRYSPSALLAEVGPLKAFVPTNLKERITRDRACPYKGMATFLKCGEGLGLPFDLVPLRHSVVLRFREVTPATLYMYGRADNPSDIMW